MGHRAERLGRGYCFVAILELDCHRAHATCHYKQGAELAFPTHARPPVYVSLSDAEIGGVVLLCRTTFCSTPAKAPPRTIAAKALCQPGLLGG